MAETNRPVRRNINTLSPDDPVIEAYRSAIVQMQALPSSDRRSWDNQARIHEDFCPHGNWLFLPWHRVYLLYFERICRKLSGMKDFALPYWDWTSSPRLPAAFWGDVSNPLFHMQRAATEISTAAMGTVGPMVVGGILEEPSFFLFASGSIAATDDQRTLSMYGALEGTPHNYIHGFVGGTMATFMSPLDPIFWLHHNMVERCWVDWNLIRNHPNTNDPAWTERTFTEFVDEDGNPVEVTVAESLLFPLNEYQYDTWFTTDSEVGLVERERERRLRSGEQAERADMERRARTGAPVGMDVVTSFPARQPVTASIGQPATISLPVQRDAFRSIIREPGRDPGREPVEEPGREPGERSVLVFEGVSLNHSEDFYVHVFINKPDATAETPTSDPHFVRHFAFFGDAHGKHTPTGSYIMDVTETLQRLNLRGGPIDVNLVLVPFPDRTLRTRSLSVASTELRVIRDIGIQPRP